ncbi:MAG: hypothetical protein QXI61_06395 [Nitrososphaerota archaeon]
MKGLKYGESFESALSQDLLIRTLFIEIFTIFTASAIILGIFTLLIIPVLILIAASTLIGLWWVGWELKRKKRRLSVCRVINVRMLTHVTAPTGIAGSLISMEYVYYLIEIVCNGINVKYIDFEERRIGETLVVLLDHNNRVVAVAPISNPPRIEILKKLV